MTGARRIENAIRGAAKDGRLAIVAFITAGFPDLDRFGDIFAEIGEHADVIEVGVPFSDPMADGATIQRSSRVALQNHASLSWLIDVSPILLKRVDAPVLFMSYLNPLLAFGLDRLTEAMAAAGVAGLIAPDLPFEEARELRQRFEAADLALIQMVSRLTPADRLKKLCRDARGFVYAVTDTGTTGGAASITPDMTEYLKRVRAASTAPVCAGFGIRAPEQLAQLKGAVDGVVIGSAIVETVDSGKSVGAFLKSFGR
jgi:tryptophan synthase alpha chain